MSDTVKHCAVILLCVSMSVPHYYYTYLLSVYVTKCDVSVFVLKAPSKVFLSGTTR